ncbi:hypothetical protein [Nocardioides sp.]|uniref:hypothetical protein n=1 Tax=Nocardioides sp. TaxID=35761 RepID=UPI0035136ADC
MTEAVTPSAAGAPEPGQSFRDFAALRAADFEESPQLKIKRLEKLLVDERRFSVKVTRQLHRSMAKDLREAQQRAKDAEARAAAATKAAAQAERRLAGARERARAAEAEVAALRASTTWRAGRVLTALPGRLKRRG